MVETWATTALHCLRIGHHSSNPAVRHDKIFSNRLKNHRTARRNTPHASRGGCGGAGGAPVPGKGPLPRSADLARFWRPSAGQPPPFSASAEANHDAYVPIWVGNHSDVSGIDSEPSHNVQTCLELLGIAWNCRRGLRNFSSQLRELSCPDPHSQPCVRQKSSA